MDEQTVVVPGAEAAALTVPSPANSLMTGLEQRKPLAGWIEELQAAHQPSTVPTSMSGADYAELARTAVSSESSILGEQPSPRRNFAISMRSRYRASCAQGAEP
ncbi:hypothetical protein ACFXGI_07290 [Streptomyces sp. NPDC059355]|uniref:hypothetical protein n=1 Tax=Streptomyces sp. NPDC059355 TaxID=3346811 RepID=UPI0036A6FF3D